MNDIQKLSVLIVVMAAVLSDLYVRRIPNGIIAAGLACGFFYQCIFGGGIGICLYLGGLLMPLLLLGWLYYFRMIGAGDIKLLSVVGGFLGPYACLRNMMAALLFAGGIACWIMIRKRIMWSRMLYLTEYMNHYVQKKKWRPYLKEVEESARFSFSVPVLFAVLCYMADADIYIINRENVPWLVEKSGLPFDYDCVIVDELSSFKNWQAKRFKALMKVRPKIRRIVGLTGTPSSNGLMDLFAEFKVLDMGQRLGRFISQYRLNYFKPDRMNGPIVYTYKLLPGAEERIYDRISDITISMKAADYLDMPELISTEYKVYLDDDERAKYEEMKDELVLQLPGGEITAANAASLSGKLSQLANGAIYDDDGSVNAFHERKLDALEDLIEAANGKPIMVAYWFKHDLSRITERLKHLKVNFEKLDSDKSIENWNAGMLQVGLIHPASAGHGLNLQSGGNVIVWFGITWSLELYQQTIARLWRQGQTSGTVTVIHIVTDGTVDERILKALAAKDNTQKALIDAVKAEVVMHGR